jgi:hypothetical protein
LLGLGLRQLQEAVDHKANDVQREFVSLSEELASLNAQMLELEGDERKTHQAKIKAARARQVVVAEEINTWRERARKVVQTRGGQSLRKYIEELKGLGDDRITAAADHALWAMDKPEEAAEAMVRANAQPDERTPAGRLIERGRKEYDLRLGDRAARVRAAIEFANRPGMSQDEAAIRELEAAMADSDPLVRDLAVLAVIQLHRTRAASLADLDQAFDSVKRLARVDDPAAVQPLADIANNPRTGFTLDQAGEPHETDNSRARLVALLRLVELHTEEAKSAVHARQFDRNAEIAATAKRALELFPGTWSGPLKRKGKSAVDS